MRKVCVVVTTRPSHARIKSVLEAVRDRPDLELQLVVGASALLERYGPAIAVIRADGFEPDAFDPFDRYAGVGDEFDVDAGSDRISKRIRKFREEDDLPHAYFFKNLAPEDFLRLINRARCVLGSSSMELRECSYLGGPRGEHRHPPARARARPQRHRRRQLERCDPCRPRTPPVGRAGASRAPLRRRAGGERIASVLATCELAIEKRLTY